MVTRARRPARRPLGGGAGIGPSSRCGHATRTDDAACRLPVGSAPMAQPFRLGLMYDCRMRPGTNTMRDVYSAVVEQTALADRLGFDFVWFTEHHFVPDGYLPAFQPVAGAVAAVTERIRISNDIALLPL